MPTATICSADFGPKFFNDAMRLGVFDIQP